MDEFRNSVVVVTGGASGIGKAVSSKFIGLGAKVAVVDNSDKLDVESEGAGNIRAYRCDVTREDEVARVISEVREELGAISGLVNCAGIIRMGLLTETPLRDWKDSIDVNLTGTFLMCREVVRGMVADGRGSVVNMASWLGKSGVANYGSYCVSKFGILGLTETLALECARHGVRVNAVCPGTIMETGMRDAADKRSRELGLSVAKEREDNIPIGRVGTPDDVTDVVLFLMSRAARYMTGQAINVSGGLWRK